MPIIYIPWTMAMAIVSPSPKCAVSFLDVCFKSPSLGIQTAGDIDIMTS